MSFTGDLDPTLEASVTDDYKKAAYWLPFQAVQIQQVFSQNELGDLANFISDMKNAADDNERIARLVNYGGVVVKLLKLARIVT
jgi:hypothetical protein